MEGGEEQAEELRALYAELEKGLTKLDRVGSPEQQKRLLKQLTGKMAEAKRVIKEFTQNEEFRTAAYKLFGRCLGGGAAAAAVSSSVAYYQRE